ncbi:hypothetical protein GCM10023148_00950 [Actinokineospora soli]
MVGVGAVGIIWMRLVPVADGVHRAVWLHSALGLGDAVVVEDDGAAAREWRAVADVVVAGGAVDAAVRSYVDELHRCARARCSPSRRPGIRTTRRPPSTR